MQGKKRRQYLESENGSFLDRFAEDLSRFEKISNDPKTIRTLENPRKPAFLLVEAAGIEQTAIPHHYSL
jgi:hypothetical protein